MMGRTHAVSGAVAYLAAAPLLPPLTTPQLAAGVAVSAAAALLPDIDHPQSTISRALWPIGPILGRALQRAGRRESTHCALTLALYAVAAAFIVAQFHNPDLWWIAPAVGIGATTHSIGDTVTNHGVAWLWPFTRRHFVVALPSFTVKLWRWRLTMGGALSTGKRPELVVRAACWVALYVLAVDYFNAWPYVEYGLSYVV